MEGRPQRNGWEEVEGPPTWKKGRPHTRGGEMREGRHLQVHSWAATKLFCTFSVLSAHAANVRYQTPSRSSAPFFTAAPHAKMEAIVRDVRGFVRCVRPLLIGLFPRTVHVPYPWAVQEGFDDFTAHDRRLLPPLCLVALEHVRCSVPMVPLVVGVDVESEKQVPKGERAQRATTRSGTHGHTANAAKPNHANHLVQIQTKPTQHPPTRHHPTNTQHRTTPRQPGDTQHQTNTQHNTHENLTTPTQRHPTPPRTIQQPPHAPLTKLLSCVRPC